MYSESRRSKAYLAGVDAVVVVGGVAAAVLGLVAHTLPQVVHAVLAARAENQTRENVGISLEVQKSRVGFGLV